MACAVAAMVSARSAAICARSSASSCTFRRIDAATSAQLAMLEEHMHRLPKHVVKHLDDFLVDERALCVRGYGVIALGSR
jgi:hypothetical protein